MSHKKSPYNRYMKSRKWQKKRKAFFKHLKSINSLHCYTCHAPWMKGENLFAVHHKTYERFGNEIFDDLQLMCVECHSAHHQPQKQKAEKRFLQNFWFDIHENDDHMKHFKSL